MKILSKLKVLFRDSETYSGFEKNSKKKYGIQTNTKLDAEVNINLELENKSQQIINIDADKYHKHDEI